MIPSWTHKFGSESWLCVNPWWTDDENRPALTHRPRGDLRGLDYTWIMRIAVVIALLGMACGAAGHATSPPADPMGSVGSHAPLATLERTACYGFCPVYKVTIFRDGAVEYEGEQFVKVRGRAAGRISAGQLDELDALFQRNGYLQLASSYQKQNVTDLPSAFTSYSPAPGRTKSVKHYLGDFSAPEALTRVEEGIDRIVHIEQWIGTPEERQHLPRT